MDKKIFIKIVQNVNKITSKIQSVEDVLDCYFDKLYEPINNIIDAVEEDMCSYDVNKEFTDKTFEILYSSSDEKELSELYDKILQGDKEYVNM